jgi:hypothetical protein
LGDRRARECVEDCKLQQFLESALASQSEGLY